MRQNKDKIESWSTHRYVKMTKISKHKYLKMSYLEYLDCETVDYTI